jgi:hypothetical protein
LGVYPRPQSHAKHPPDRRLSDSVVPTGLLDPPGVFNLPVAQRAIIGCDLSPFLRSARSKDRKFITDGEPTGRVPTKSAKASTGSRGLG